MLTDINYFTGRNFREGKKFMRRNK